MLTFGGHLTLFRFLTYLGRNVDDILIGRFVGASALGFYSKAYQLLLFPIQALTGPLGPVVIGTLSRLTNEPHKFRSSYLQVIALTTFLGMPAICFLAVAARDVILLVLGPQWSEAAVLFQLLAPAALVATFNAAGSWVCVPLGYSRRLLLWQIFATSVVISAFVIGLKANGVEGLALAYSITSVLLVFPGLGFLLRPSPISLTDILGVLWRPAVASVLAGGVGFLVLGSLPEWSAPMRIATGFLVCAGCYLAAWLILPGGAAFLRSLVVLAWDHAGGVRLPLLLRRSRS